MTKSKIHPAFLASSLILILSSVSFYLPVGALWAEGPGDEGHSSSYSASSSADYEGPQATEDDLEINSPSSLELETGNNKKKKDRGEVSRVLKDNLLNIVIEPVSGWREGIQIAEDLRNNKDFFATKKFSQNIRYTDDHNLKEIADALGVNSSLDSLNLGGGLFHDLSGKRVRERRVIRDDGAIALGNALTTNSSLEKLNLAIVSDEGAKAIGEGLKNNQALKKLELGVISDQGMEAIAEALKSNNHLESLKVFGPINEEGKSALIEALKINSSLKRVQFNDEFLVESSNMKDKVIHELLKRNSILSQVEKDPILWPKYWEGGTYPQKDVFRASRVSDEGIKEAFETLEKSSSYPKAIYLMLSEISDEGVKTIAENIKKNPKLEELNLLYSTISVEGEQMLLEALQHNENLTYLRYQYADLKDSMGLPQDTANIFNNKTETRKKIQKILKNNKKNNKIGKTLK